MIVKVPNKLQLDNKIVGEAQGYSYIKGNRTCAFQLKLRPDSSVVDTRSMPIRSPEMCVHQALHLCFKYGMMKQFRENLGKFYIINFFMVLQQSNKTMMKLVNRSF